MARNPRRPHLNAEAAIGASGSGDWSKSALGMGLARVPWSPTAEDGRLLLEAVGHRVTGGKTASLVTVLGATPGVTQLSWPLGSKVLAVDASETMIRSRWRANPSVPSAVVCGRWQALPLPDTSVAAVVGDGSLNALSYAAYRDLFAEIARVLAGDGIFVARCFVRPALPIDIDEIRRELADRRFPTSAQFRLRLCMALAAESDGSIVLGELLERFNTLFPDRAELADIAGWGIDEVERFDLDRNSEILLTFPSLPELASYAEPQFAIGEVRHGSYGLADLCPTITFVPSTGR